ncbi:hypothetical protein [Streptomyces sp. NBC_01637]|uniref:hypothetical protein n=1 Tax=unclassified Streptomyces TaxID=2593676 RepID=UPI003864E994|nr:hypothetical protein OH719_31065 [Streptomyces sp. NBC_01653]WTD33467.1 hypothetical protein OHB03_15225 [Streptomyces sp. NBC_01643]WTD88958.1 hypothetical protein OG891_15805 [Streptomyces sp. NBC_01637]
MTQNTPLSPCHFRLPVGERQRVLSVEQLKTLGVSPARAAAQCRAGGPWQQPLPGVYVLHPGPPTGEERLRSALLYVGRRRAVPAQGGAARSTGYGEAMVTGPAALALHGFSLVPPMSSLDRIDVLVPRTRRLRSVRYVRVVRTTELPRPEQLAGLPVAPVARALADAVTGLGDTGAVRLLLTEAVRGGHCEPAAVVRELSRSKLLDRPHIVNAVDSLLAEGRALAESRLYDMVRTYDLPEPLWNVDLRLPGGPHLGGVDAYWPDQAVAVELDSRAPLHSTLDGDRRQEGHDADRSGCAAEREHLERLGVTVVHVAPRKLRIAADQQATVVRTALMAAADREPAAYVVILPR